MIRFSSNNGKCANMHKIITSRGVHTGENTEQLSFSSLRNSILSDTHLIRTCKLIVAFCIYLKLIFPVVSLSFPLSDHHSVHCGSIRQTATILSMNRDCLRTGDKASVHFRFIKTPEYLHCDQRLVFREGRTKAVGTITKVATPSGRWRKLTLGYDWRNVAHCIQRCGFYLFFYLPQPCARF